MRASDLILPSLYAKHVTGGEFHRPPHIRLLEREVMRVVHGNDWDILVAMAPPRHGKSWYLSKWFPAWYHGVYPRNRSILSSYALGLARSHGRWVKDTVHQYAPIWGTKGVNPWASAAADWETVEQGGMVSAGVGGGITGRAANLLLIDDAVKNAAEAISEGKRKATWEWFQSTAFTRLEPGGKCIALGTRWHESDLLGMILKSALEDGIGEDGTKLRVREVRLPALAMPTDTEPDPLGRQTDEALWPERYTTADLKRIRATLGAYWFDALYQQKLGTYGENEWPDSYFWGVYAQEDEWPESFALSATALDPSKGKDARKGDYQAIVTVGFKDGYLWVDCDAKRRPVPQMVEDFVLWNIERRPTVTGIESNAFQELLAESYVASAQKYNYFVEPVLINNTVNKGLRIGRLGFWLRLHRIKVRNNAGGKLLVDQMKEFPNGKHDDCPDALEQAIRLLLQISESLAGIYQDALSDQEVLGV